MNSTTRTACALAALLAVAGAATAQTPAETTSPTRDAVRSEAKAASKDNSTQHRGEMASTKPMDKGNVPTAANSRESVKAETRAANEAKQIRPGERGAKPMEAKPGHNMSENSREAVKEETRIANRNHTIPMGQQSSNEVKK